MLELVLPEKRSIARLLARWDRGKFARPLEEWQSLFEGFSSQLFTSTIRYRHGCHLVEHGVLQGKAAGMSGAPRVSLAIPVFNEEAVVPELVRRTTAVLDGIPAVLTKLFWWMTVAPTARWNSWNRRRRRTQGSCWSRFLAISAIRRRWRRPWTRFPATWRFCSTEICRIRRKLCPRCWNGTARL